MDAASKANVTLYHPGEVLGVCIMTADFWGSPTAGGTATAYHLLAQVPPGGGGGQTTLNREQLYNKQVFASSRKQTATPPRLQ